MHVQSCYFANHWTYCFVLRSCCSVVILLANHCTYCFVLYSCCHRLRWILPDVRQKEDSLKICLNLHKPGLKSGSKNGFSNGFSISSLKFLQDQLAVSDETIFVVYKMLVICTFRSFGRQIKCGAAKKNVLSIRFLWAKSRSNSRGLRHTPQTRTRWSIT